MELNNEDKTNFLRSFNLLGASIHQNAVAHGFWNQKEKRNDGEALMLMVVEIAEAVQGIRAGNPPGDHIPEFTTEEEELADTIIRLVDYSVGKNLRLGLAILAKMDYNTTRPYKHGKEF